ncbi:hypothetical protein ACMAZF_13355 [Psychrobium sp. nBUS_13]|uniref:hypothetical protein n=1 Tax=Psychrobium sp. nBUS_13 TaxID=3395319 RepID=UPI003EB8F1D3
MITMLDKLERPICDSDEIKAIEQLSQERNVAINNLFLNFSGAALSQHPSLLDEFQSIDKQLTQHAEHLKTLMSKQILTQKKNTKATQLYKSI